jgi:hypothetical protein
VEKPEETKHCPVDSHRWDGDDKIYIKELDCEVAD